MTTRHVTRSAGRIVVKVGSGVLTQDGTLRPRVFTDLARQISVQIESAVVDVTKETNGRLENDLTSRIRATSDVRIDGIRFETHRKRKRVWALAILERLPASVARRKARDRALAMTRQCLETAERQESAGRATQALATYRSCRAPLEEALSHEAIASALADDLRSLIGRAPGQGMSRGGIAQDP